MLNTSKLYLKELKLKFSHHLVIVWLKESQEMFNSPGNISGASQLNSITAFSWTAAVDGDLFQNVFFLKNKRNKTNKCLQTARCVWSKSGSPEIDMKRRYLRPWCRVELVHVDTFSSAAAAKFHLKKETKQRVQLNEATLLCCAAPHMFYRWPNWIKCFISILFFKVQYSTWLLSCTDGDFGEF